MTNQSIYQKIEQKGQADAKEIKRQGNEKAEQTKKQMIDQAQAEIDQMLASTKAKMDDQIKTKSTQIEQKAKQQSLSVKKQLIDKVMEETFEKLLEIKDEEFMSLVVRMIQKESLRGNEILKVSKKEFERYRKVFSAEKEKDGIYMLDGLNKALKDGKYQLGLSKEPVDIDGGFILVSDSFDIDFTYRTLLAELKESYEPEIAKILFASGE